MSSHGHSNKQGNNVNISHLIATGGKPVKVPAPLVLTEILPNKIYISNLEGANAVDKIVALGITHVVALLRTKMNNPYPSTIQRLWIPVVDTAAAVDGFEQLWPTPLQFLRDCMDKNGRALIHCRAGMSRSSTILLAHMLEYHHYTLRDAWTLLYTKHPSASPLTPFFKALVSFECRLYHSQPTPSPASASPSNVTIGPVPVPVRPTSPPASSHASSLSPPLPPGEGGIGGTSPPSSSSSSSSSNASPSTFISSPSPNSTVVSSSSSSTTSPTQTSSSSTPVSVPTITLFDYHIQMLRTIFPNTKEKDFLEVVKQCNNNWLTAARIYHQQHPAALLSFAMRFGGGASFYHPFCDGVV